MNDEQDIERDRADEDGERADEGGPQSFILLQTRYEELCEQARTQLRALLRSA
jgi:hypothetical protein